MKKKKLFYFENTVGLIFFILSNCLTMKIIKLVVKNIERRY